MIWDKQVTLKFQEEVDQNLKTNYDTLQSQFKDYMQENGLNSYNVG